MRMNTIDKWQHEAYLIEYLAQQLIKGRLGLFLGAGISQFYDLPDWRALLNKLLADHSGAPLKDTDDVILKAGVIRTRYYKNDVAGFKAALKQALYESVTLDFSKIRKNPTLSAIGSLVMSSRRGSAAKIFTLNYDDLLENYLEFHGFTTASVFNDIHWAEDEDVVIYHPHGFLPLADRPESPDIVLGTQDYHDIIQSPLWRPLLETALRTHTFIQIGLSGFDSHLQSLLASVKDKHAIKTDHTRYSAVRFALEGEEDEVGEVLEEYDVYTHRLLNYDELPEFLFKICQSARAQRMVNR